MTTRRTVLIAGLSLAVVSLFGPLPALAADGAPAGMARISVTVEGSGSDVVLIPGLNSSPRVWKEMMAALLSQHLH